jgi:hypothetical protein
VKCSLLPPLLEILVAATTTPNQNLPSHNANSRQSCHTRLPILPFDIQVAVGFFLRLMYHGASASAPLPSILSIAALDAMTLRRFISRLCSPWSFCTTTPPRSKSLLLGLDHNTTHLSLSTCRNMLSSTCLTSALQIHSSSFVTNRNCHYTPAACRCLPSQCLACFLYALPKHSFTLSLQMPHNCCLAPCVHILRLSTYTSSSNTLSFLFLLGLLPICALYTLDLRLSRRNLW